MTGVAIIDKIGQWYGRHKKPLWLSLAAILVLSIAVQLIYPYGHALPFASVAGESVGMKKQPEITLAVQNRFSMANVKLKAGEREDTNQLSYFGASVAANEMAEHATNYPMTMRFVPLSILWYQPNLDRYQLSFDDKRLKTTASEYSKAMSYPATDANLAIKDGQLTVTEAQSGQSVTTDQLEAAFKTSSFNWDETTITLDPTVVEPAVSDASIADVKHQAEAILAQNIKVTVDGRRDFTPERSTVASWLKVTKNDTSGQVELDYDKAAIDKFVASIAKETDTAPQPVKVQLVDGDERSRSGGKNGLGINRASLTNQISQSLETPSSSGVVLASSRQPIKPPINYDRSYTSSEKGLKAYVDHMTSRGNIKIAVTQLDGDEWTAFGQANDSIPSASTYKPYLMLRVLDDVRTKDLAWDDKIADSTVRDCFEDMIVVSANPCAEALIKKYGIGPLTKYLREEKGFSNGTGFTFREVTQTTAADLNKLMTGIENRDLLKGQYRDMMLEKMGRQVYRQGIPAGTGASVYNKVGFLWDYLHDTAIVKHPEGTYVLTVMTKGESWGKIADITRQVERIMYP